MLRACRIVGCVVIGIIVGGGAGAVVGGLASNCLDLDTTAAGALPLLGFLPGSLLGGHLGLTLALGGWGKSDALRYDLWLDADGQDRERIHHLVGALLGLDPSQARKLVDSQAPLRRAARRAEAEYLQARFSDFGVKVRVIPSSASHE